MKIEEAIVYVLAKRNGGLKTDQIKMFPDTFVVTQGRVFLMI